MYETKNETAGNRTGFKADETSQEIGNTLMIFSLSMCQAKLRNKDLNNKFYKNKG